jgi:hypothetical protein
MRSYLLGFPECRKTNISTGIPSLFVLQHRSCTPLPQVNPWDIISGGLLPIQAYLGYYVASKMCTSTPGTIHGISYREGCYPSRPPWGSTSPRKCAPLPQVQSMGYHIGRAVTHPGLPGVLRRLENVLFYPRFNPWDIISGGLLPTQAYRGYYVASKLRSSTPDPILLDIFIARTVTHPGLSGVQRRVLLYPRPISWDIISGFLPSHALPPGIYY